eukprot:g13459.t1
MPRSRKQVARFDPSPEAVASWNDTSGKTRVVVDLQARVRLGLASAEAAAAAIAAAKAKAAAEAEAAAAAAAAAERGGLHRRQPAGRKRQRPSAAGDRSSTGSSGSKWPPPISDLRASGHHASPQLQGGGGGSSVTDTSSISCSTSGSGSDSDSSYSSAAILTSNQDPPRLAWRPPQPSGGRRTSGGGGGASTSASASGASDTDSEYCSDILPGQHARCSSAASCATSDRSSSCSATPLGFGEGTCDGADHAGRVSPNGVGGGSARAGDDEVQEEEPQERAAKKRRNVVTVRVARSQMPARWAAPPPPFETCLKDVRPEDKLGGGAGAVAGCGGDDAAAAAAASMLGLCEGDVVDAKNWLSSGFIDVVMAKFARTYTNVHFMPIDFAVLCLNGWGATETNAAVAQAPGPSPQPPSSTTGGEGGSSVDGSCGAGGGVAGAGGGVADESMVFKDILGRPIVYAEKRPVIFVTHVNNVHWNLLRVEHDPVPELQLFEPMGKPPRRQGGSRYTQQQPGGGGGARGGGFRCIPKEVYRWLDTVWPLRSVESPGGGDGRSINPGVGGGSGPRRKSPSPTPPHEGWASRAYSAITRQQQTTGFDCGVASLLYAEKCGQGQMREDVDAYTTQGDMTEYRRALQRYVEEVLRQPPPAPAAAPPAAVANTPVPSPSASAALSSSSSSAPSGCTAKPEVVVVDPPPSPLPLPLPPSSAAVAVPAALPDALDP